MSRFNLIAELESISLVLLLCVSPSLQSVHAQAQNPSLIDPLPSNMKIMGDFAKSPVDDLFAIATTDGQVLLWSSETQTIMRELEGNWNIHCNTLTWSPGGNFKVYPIVKTVKSSFDQWMGLLS